MSTINKSQFWQDHITAWQSSDLPQATYCIQHEIKFHNFAYWRNRLSHAKVPYSHFDCAGQPRCAV
jgi:hypothetical protein